MRAGWHRPLLSLKTLKKGVNIMQATQEEITVKVKATPTPTTPPYGNSGTMKRCQNCNQVFIDSSRFCPRDGGNLEEVQSDLTTRAGQPATGTQANLDEMMIGRVLAGRYRLLSKIGQGGMGAVYKGEHVKMNRSTAIKVLTSDLSSNPEFVARFEREAEMASRIEHPNAVSIYDFGEAEGGLVYLAMEFLDGQSLSDIIKQEAPLPLDRVVSIACQAAEALDVAHRLGIVHRDFKPDNVMACRKTGRLENEMVKVLDFGIAKQTLTEHGQAALTQTGFVLGTPQYMSPEQVAGENLDGRSDLYSLALVTYEMLSGAFPFAGTSAQSVVVKRLLEHPTPLSKANPHLDLPPEVEPVIMKALARNPDDRYRSTAEFAADLKRAAQTRPKTILASALATVPMEVPLTETLNQTKQQESGAIAVEQTLRSFEQTPRSSRKVIAIAAGLAVVVLAAVLSIYLAGSKGSQAPGSASHNETAALQPGQATQLAQTSATPSGQPNQESMTVPVSSQTGQPEKKDKNKTQDSGGQTTPEAASNAGNSGSSASPASPPVEAPRPAEVPAAVEAPKPPDPKPAEAVKPAPVEEAKTGVRVEASAIKRVTPVYPAAAQTYGIKGTVVVEVSINDKGSVTAAKVVSGHATLGAAAVEAARGWKYSPAKIDGKAINSTATIRFNF
jgi:TonB family protein